MTLFFKFCGIPRSCYLSPLVDWCDWITITLYTLEENLKGFYFIYISKQYPSLLDGFMQLDVLDIL